MASGSFPILFITASRIGDATLSSGLVRRLAEEIPNARFTIVAGPEAAPLFAEAPGLARLIPFPKAKDGGHWFRLWRQVRGVRWGLAVDLRGSGVSRFLHARRRAIHRRPAQPVHKVLEAARTLGLEDDPPAPFIFTSPETDAKAATLTAGPSPILALAPAANWIGKTWPVERFCQTAIRLLNTDGPLKGGRLMVLGGPNDAKLAAQLKDVTARDRVINLIGQDLTTAYACLRRARLFIGNDSGTMHLAAAAGAPTLGLFGPSDEALYAPWGPRARAVRGVRSYEQVRAADPQFTQAMCHMMDLSVDRVLRNARDLLAATEPQDD